MDQDRTFLPRSLTGANAVPTYSKGTTAGATYWGGRRQGLRSPRADVTMKFSESSEIAMGKGRAWGEATKSQSDGREERNEETSAQPEVD
jgi:hypothetical protein